MAVKPTTGTGGKKASVPSDHSITLAELAQRVTGDESALPQLLEVASAHVERYAPGAPVACRNEAIVRFVGYLAAASPGHLRRLDVGNTELEFVSNHASAFRNSGAAMLLSPWRVRHAGTI